MAALKRAATVLVALIVDDGALAGLVVAWVLVATTLLPAVISGDAIRATLLFAGLACALVASALRTAILKRSRPPPHED